MRLFKNIFKMRLLTNIFKMRLLTNIFKMRLLTNGSTLLIFFLNRSFMDVKSKPVFF